MKSIEISNIKKFTTALFTGEDFDSFGVAECQFATLINVTIDGHTNKDFLRTPDGQESANVPKTVLWSQLRPLAFSIIKGRRLPLKFKIVLLVPEEKISSFLNNSGLSSRAEDVATLCLNIRYENGQLSCTTGTSMKTFTPDRSVEQAWDASMAKFLEKYEKE